MIDRVLIVAVFIGFLLLFTVVGIYSATRKQNTTTDYLLASRNVNPWLTALSAMATNQSGFVFVGQVGLAYKLGISAIWLPLGFVIGDYIAWSLFVRSLRERSEETASETVSSFLGQETRGMRWITVLSALIIIGFLGTYAAAQLIAGSKTLNAVFGWNYHLGIVLGSIIVVIYCFSGGIRASIWTDAVQGAVMNFSLVLLLTVAIVNCGGIGELWRSLGDIDSNLVDFSPPNLKWGILPFIIGWVFAGMGVVGQPHIMVRAMAIDSAENLGLARNIKVICMLANVLSAVGVGLCARVLMPELMTSGDPELALPYLSLELLPVVLVGFMLAGLFAATISTADSQILSCSAALTQDLVPAAASSYRMAKIGTLTVTAIVLAIALAANDNVFTLVTLSWSALASALGPLLVLRAWQQPLNTPVAIAMMVAGIATTLIWNLGLKLSGAMYEGFPSIVAGIIVYGLYRIYAVLVRV